MICSYVFKARQCIKAIACSRFVLFNSRILFAIFRRYSYDSQTQQLRFDLSERQQKVVKLVFPWAHFTSYHSTQARNNGVMHSRNLGHTLLTLCVYRCAHRHIIPHVKPAIRRYDNRKSCMHNFTLIAGSIFYLYIIFL